MAILVSRPRRSSSSPSSTPRRSSSCVTLPTIRRHSRKLKASVILRPSTNSTRMPLGSRSFWTTLRSRSRLLTCEKVDLASPSPSTRTLTSSAQTSSHSSSSSQQHMSQRKALLITAHSPYSRLPSATRRLRAPYQSGRRLSSSCQGPLTKTILMRPKLRLNSRKWSMSSVLTYLS